MGCSAEAGEHALGKAGDGAGFDNGFSHMPTEAFSEVGRELKGATEAPRHRGIEERSTKYQVAGNGVFVRQEAVTESRLANCMGPSLRSG